VCCEIEQCGEPFERFVARTGVRRTQWPGRAAFKRCSSSVATRRIAGLFRHSFWRRNALTRAVPTRRHIAETATSITLRGKLPYAAMLYHRARAMRIAGPSAHRTG
jgi:hypothetical protein